MPQPLFKQSTSPENFPFEMLIGEKLNFDFYELNDEVDAKYARYFADSYFSSIGPGLEDGWSPFIVYCKQKDAVLKSLSFSFAGEFENFLQTHYHRKYATPSFPGKILKLDVLVTNQNQEVHFMLENGATLRVMASLVKRATSLEPHEFEMLCGQEINYSYYRKGEVVNDFGELCAYDQTLVKGFYVNFQQSFESFFSKNSWKKLPFKKIIAVKIRSRQCFVKCDDNRTYYFDIVQWSAKFTWQVYFFKDAFVLPIDNSNGHFINHNILLRLPSSFFTQIKNTDEQQRIHLQQCFERDKSSPIRNNPQRHSWEDYHIEVLGLQPDDIWNLH